MLNHKETVTESRVVLQVVLNDLTCSDAEAGNDIYEQTLSQADVAIQHARALFRDAWKREPQAVVTPHLKPNDVSFQLGAQRDMDDGRICVSPLANCEREISTQEKNFLWQLLLKAFEDVCGADNVKLRQVLQVHKKTITETRTMF